MQLNGKTLRCIGSGLECRVYAVDKKFVVKMYGSKGERNRAYARQLKAHKAGFAPEVVEKVNVETNRVFKYGYVSQRARKGFTASEADLRRLQRSAKKFGWRTGDIHHWNVGLILMPVIVDFGDASLQ